MSEQPLGGCDKPDYKAFMRLTAWLFLASLVLAAMLPFTNRRGWTHDAPWGPPAFVAALAVYGWLFARWQRWGERRRTSGQGSLFGHHSRIGATSESHFWLFHTGGCAAACLVSGAISNEGSPLQLMMIVPPLIVPSVLTFVPMQLHKLFSRFLAVFIGIPGFVLFTHTFRHSRIGLAAHSLEFRAIVFAIGVTFLAVMLEWHALIALREQQTESKTT